MAALAKLPPTLALCTGFSAVHSGRQLRLYSQRCGHVGENNMCLQLYLLGYATVRETALQLHNVQCARAQGWVLPLSLWPGQCLHRCGQASQNNKRLHPASVVKR